MFCRLGAEDVTDDAVDALRIRWTNLFISDSSSFIRGVVRGERFARGNGSGGLQLQHSAVRNEGIVEVAG